MSTNKRYAMISSKISCKNVLVSVVALLCITNVFLFGLDSKGMERTLDQALSFTEAEERA
jgi:hypothetical protein